MEKLEEQAGRLQARYDSLQTRSGSGVRKLSSATDELGKLQRERDSFLAWQGQRESELAELEGATCDLAALRRHVGDARTLSADVMSHKADLRFVALSADKFQAEAQAYLSQLNDNRKAHEMEPLVEAEGLVRCSVDEASERYDALLDKCHTLSDQLSTVDDKSKQYGEAVEKARTWLDGAEKSAHEQLTAPADADPRAVQDHLARLKVVNADVMAQRRLVEGAGAAHAALAAALEHGSEEEQGKLAAAVEEVERRYEEVGVRLLGTFKYGRISPIGRGSKGCVRGVMSRTVGYHRGFRKFVP
ncbi:PREDICTED: dystonin-like [Priapulus caudatus]|uniref:Dystonin-like n=1 Tax=Priapulus caudatus TaxID=37621 RepID=A0ABM1F8R4_PRICU|nr:PREDICTED: dystonin-like [Priapulus caudatus]